MSVLDELLVLGAVQLQDRQAGADTDIRHCLSTDSLPLVRGIMRILPRTLTPGYPDSFYYDTYHYQHVLCVSVVVVTLSSVAPWKVLMDVLSTSRYSGLCLRSSTDFRLRDHTVNTVDAFRMTLSRPMPFLAYHSSHRGPSTTNLRRSRLSSLTSRFTAGTQMMSLLRFVQSTTRLSPVYWSMPGSTTITCPQHSQGHGVYRHVIITTHTHPGQPLGKALPLSP